MALLSDLIEEFEDPEEAIFYGYALFVGDYPTFEEYIERIAGPDIDQDGFADDGLDAVEGIDYLVLKPHMECVVLEIRHYFDTSEEGETSPYEALIWHDEGYVVNDPVGRGEEFAFARCEDLTGIFSKDLLGHGDSNYVVVKELP